MGGSGSTVCRVERSHQRGRERGWRVEPQINRVRYWGSKTQWFELVGGTPQRSGSAPPHPNCWNGSTSPLDRLWFLSCPLFNYVPFVFLSDPLFKTSSGRGSTRCGKRGRPPAAPAGRPPPLPSPPGEVGSTWMICPDGRSRIAEGHSVITSGDHLAAFGCVSGFKY